MKLCAPGEPVFLFIVCLFFYFYSASAYLLYIAL